MLDPVLTGFLVGRAAGLCVVGAPRFAFRRVGLGAVGRGCGLLTCCRVGFLRGGVVGLASGCAVGRRSGVTAFAANTRREVGLAAGLMAPCRALASASPSEPTGFSVVPAIACFPAAVPTVGAAWGLLGGGGGTAGRRGEGTALAAVLLAARSAPGAALAPVAGLTCVAALSIGGGSLSCGGGGLAPGGGGMPSAGAAAEAEDLVTALTGAGLSSPTGPAAAAADGGGSAICFPAADFTSVTGPRSEGGGWRSADARLLPRCCCDDSSSWWSRSSLWACASKDRRLSSCQMVTLTAHESTAGR